ncbi:MAG: ribosomal RNA small subunit methyltransferase A [Candidatus Omnitrophica bacterium]|nr:ribosomal RNA small subunit methyltransferase A [Candidatus Omnitrophota bacterium]
MSHRPKKRFGQNFLVERGIQRRIIDACALKPEDIVLEIGAGRGELTRLIANKVKKVYAVELDRELLPLLKENLKNSGNVEIINQDILKLNMSSKFGGIKKKLIAIGNVPYYISTPIIEFLFNRKKKVRAVFLTVQKEFGRRIAADPGSKVYGSLSCFVQYYSVPEILFDISKGCFFPAPKVDSSFISLKIRERPLLKEKEEACFFKIVRSAFNKRRKTLRNSLSNIISKESLEKFFKEFSLSRNIRPEELSVLEFMNLARKTNLINNKKNT